MGKHGIPWKEVITSVVISVLLGVAMVEVASSALPLFQTDIRFVSEVQEWDDTYYAKFKSDVDVTYFSADMHRYAVRTSPLGIGDYNIRDDTPSAEPFAVAIGDSFTYGAELNAEEGWVSKLENMTGREIVNMGGPGQFPVTEERILSDYGLKLKPRLVIWEFMTNDFPEVEAFENAPDRGVGYSIVSWLNGHSNTYLLLKRIFNSAGGSPEKRPLVFELDGKANVFNTLDALDRLRKFCGTEYSEKAKAAVLKARDKTEASGAKFVMIMIPVKEEVYMEETAAHLGGDGDFGCAIREMMEFADENGIDYIDMTAHYRTSADAGGEPYLRLGGHLSVEGNTLTSQIIYNFLSEKGHLS